MQTNLCDSARQRAEAAEAERILRSCVHCGFCNATCPTYQELGDELDGPRGRIYLIKQFLERDEASERTRLHLDRCLSCRNCETTCPSGASTTSCWISAATSSPNACRAASGNACCATGCACWPRARGCSACWPALPGG